ncbi:MAG TPA: hypothetical protein DER60_10740, partial [Syntrophomonas sp.]|nr:hypothetical protein [Syntrophomonas sp.]
DADADADIDGDVDIPDEEVPLGDVDPVGELPKTGAAGSLLSLAGLGMLLAGLGLRRNTNKKE